MICDPCKAGDHCGPPGQASTRCPCQHRPPGTNQDVCQYACLHPQADHAPGRGCTHPGCQCLWRAQEQGQAAGRSRSEPSPVFQDPPAPAQVPGRPTEDLDLPDPGPVAPGFREVLKSVPTITLVADWMRAVRAGQSGKAGVLQGLLAERFEGRRSR